MGRSPAKIRIIGYEPNPDETTRILKLRLTYKRPAADHVLKGVKYCKNDRVRTNRPYSKLTDKIYGFRP